ncbi:MAG: helix-turn-helix transcriptional regulator [Pseudohongiellaceae bacterium]
MSHKIDFAAAPPETIEAFLGKQVETLRLGKNINQTRLAEEAGVSRRTITRLENGKGVSLDTLIRILQALGVSDRLETLLPDPAVRPIDRVRLKGRERQRARSTQNPEPAPWHWDDHQDKQ